MNQHPCTAPASNLAIQRLLRRGPSQSSVTRLVRRPSLRISSSTGRLLVRLSRPPAMSYFFATPVDIDVVLDDTDDRSMVDVKLDKNRREKAPLFMDGESVKGAVTVRPKDGKRLEHTGIKVQFIGTIGMRLFPGRP